MTPAPDHKDRLTATVDQLQAELEGLSAQVGTLFVSLCCVIALVALIELRRR